MSFGVSRKPFEKSARKYLEVPEVFKGQNDLAVLVEDKLFCLPSNEYRWLDKIYCYLAAYYRQINTPCDDLPEHLDNSNEYARQIAIGWIRFFEEEVDHMVEDQELAHAFISMTVYASDGCGRANEAYAYVLEYLRNKFPFDGDRDEISLLPGCTTVVSSKPE